MIAVPANGAGPLSARLVFSGPVGIISILLLGWLSVYGPVYLEFAETAWRRNENAHAPFLLAICIGVFLSELQRQELPIASALESILGVAMLGIVLWLFTVSRETQFDLLVSALQSFLAASLVFTFFGIRGIRALRVPLALTAYLIVWPGWFLDGVTLPLKLHISKFVAETLYMLGAPTAYAGSIITVGQYKLLVADACSGVNSMIALTSIGAVYIYAASRFAPRRRPGLANMIVIASLIPIAYIANVIRVAILVLLTHYFGHDVGQGYLHDLAGVLLFSTALALVFVVDGLALIVCRKFSQEAAAGDG